MATTLRLCDYLLNNYDNPTVKRLIDSTEMWFIPLANPDGMYRDNDNFCLWRSDYIAVGS